MAMQDALSSITFDNKLHFQLHDHWLRNLSKSQVSAKSKSNTSFKILNSFFLLLMNVDCALWPTYVIVLSKIDEKREKKICAAGNTFFSPNTLPFPLNDFLKRNLIQKDWLSLKLIQSIFFLPWVIKNVSLREFDEVARFKVRKYLNQKISFYCILSWDNNRKKKSTTFRLLHFLKQVCFEAILNLIWAAI